MGISVFILLAIFIWGNLDFDDLKYIEGKVVNVLVKEKRSGAFLSLKSSDNNQVVIFNFESIPKESNQLIRSFIGGEYIKVWYVDGLVPMKYDSEEPWQVEYKGELIVPYKDSKEGHTAFKYFFIFIMFCFLFPGLWFFYKGQ